VSDGRRERAEGEGGRQGDCPAGRGWGNTAYWKCLKAKLKREGNQLVSAATQLKMRAADGKSYRSDAGGEQEGFQPQRTQRAQRSGRDAGGKAARTEPRSP